MNIEKLKKNKELISSKVHDAWWEEKKKQGFHAPADCKSESAKSSRAHELRTHEMHTFNMFHKYCDKCHTDMYDYDVLPENVKDYDRVTVDTVLSAIEEIGV